jgi:signal peptidase II
MSARLRPTTTSKACVNAVSTLSEACVPPGSDETAALDPRQPGPAEPGAAPGTGVAGTDAATSGRAGLLWLVALATVIVDQASKALIRSTLPLYASKTLIPGLVDFVHVENAGVAFGFLNDATRAGRGLLTTALALAALAGIAYYARHIRRDEWLARIGLSLILGGAVGNLADRILQGFVVDFVDVYWRGWHFWAFNVADAAISVGAVLVFIELLFVNRHASHPV